MQNSEKILRIEDVEILTGLSRTTIWRLEKKGHFPIRRRLSQGRVGWLQSEILGWVRDLEKKRVAQQKMRSISPLWRNDEPIFENEEGGPMNGR